MNKSELLESIQNGYHLFKELLAEFDEEQLNMPGAIGKWSLKDTVAHIIAHEQRMIQWMGERLNGEHPSIPQPYAMPDDELNELNEQIYQENRFKSWKDIMQDLDSSHNNTLRLLETNAEEDLVNSTCFQLIGGEPLWEAVAANSYWHYEEHGQDIRRWQISLLATM